MIQRRDRWQDKLEWIWPMLPNNPPAIACWGKKTKHLNEELEVTIVVDRDYILHAGDEGPIWATRRAVYDSTARHLAEIPEPIHQTDKFDGMKFKEVRLWLEAHGYTKSWPTPEGEAIQEKVRALIAKEKQW